MIRASAIRAQGWQPRGHQGKDNFAVDRAVAEQAHRAFPDGGEAAGAVLLRTIGRGQLRSREEITRFFDGIAAWVVRARAPRGGDQGLAGGGPT